MDTAGDLADRSQRERWEEELRARLGTSEAELARLGQLLECLAGPLAVLCDKAAVFADQAEDLPDIIARALAANPGLSQALHGIEGIKFQFEAFHADLRRVAQNQADALPVYERINRVADYFDELWAAGIKPREFAQFLHHQREVIGKIEQGKTDGLDEVLLEMRTADPEDAQRLRAGSGRRHPRWRLSRRPARPANRRSLAAARRCPGGIVASGHGAGHRATPKSRPPAQPPQPTARLQAGDTLDGWALEARLARAAGARCSGLSETASPGAEGDAPRVRCRPCLRRALHQGDRSPHSPAAPCQPGAFRGVQFLSRQTWYLVTEYLDGPTLEKYLADKGPLTEGHVRKVFSDLIEGLAQAHAAGIVHRDIKPANLIFRRSDQRLVLVDFGLTVAVEKIGDTQIGGISVAFAAPEQHYGESATQASDVFSLCAVIHYALNYDKPELCKPHCFTSGLAPESLRHLLTAGLRAHVGERLRDAGQLHAALGKVGQPQTQQAAGPIGPSCDAVRPVEAANRGAEGPGRACRRHLRLCPGHVHPGDGANQAPRQRPAGRLDAQPRPAGGAVAASRVRLAGHERGGTGRPPRRNRRHHPDHPRAKPWLAQIGTKAERSAAAHPGQSRRHDQQRVGDETRLGAAGQVLAGRGRRHTGHHGVRPAAGVVVRRLPGHAS